jgi:hypothetical protein
MDKAALMHSADCIRKQDRDAQEFGYFQWLAEQSIERLTAGVLEDQRPAIILRLSATGRAAQAASSSALSANSCSSRFALKCGLTAIYSRGVCRIAEALNERGITALNSP